MTRDVFVVGAAHTPFGEHWNTSHRELLAHAGIEAMADARLHGEDLQAMVIGSMSSGAFLGQEHLGAVVLDEAGLADTHLPVTRVESAGASGGVALRHGVQLVRSGEADVVVVAGLEKMTDVSDADSRAIQASGIDQEWEHFMGATDAALHALVQRQYMAKHHLTRAQIAGFSVHSHQHGAKNPLAQFQRAIRLESVLGAPMLADPIGMFDAAPLSDGAACVILASEAYAKQHKVRITGSAQRTDRMRLVDRDDWTHFKATKLAAEAAYFEAGISPGDIDLVELHDNYAISHAIALEDLGLSQPGQAPKELEEGRFTHGGAVVSNPSGGLKARGHPIGASGIAQVAELTWHLRQSAGDRQVAGAKIGVAQSVGGVGTTSTIHVLEAGA